MPPEPAIGPRSSEPTCPWWTRVRVNALPLIINSGKSPRPDGQVGLGSGAGTRLNDRELKEFLETAMARLRTGLTEANLLDPVVITEDERQIARLRDELRGDVDVVLPLTAGNIYHHGWRHSTPMEVKLDIIGKPILRVAYMVWDFLGLDVVAALKALGKEAYFAATLPRANEILKTMRVKKTLSQTRIAIVGTVRSRSLMINDGVPTNIIDPALIRARTGVDVEFVPAQALKEAIESVAAKEAAALAAGWRANATEVKDIFRPGETGQRWVEYQARLYLGIKRILDSRGCTAFSGCHDPGHLFDFTAPPCYSFVVLKDEGIPCGCEGDQGALLALIMLMYLSGKPGDMGNTLIPTFTDDHMEDWMIPTPGPDVIPVSHSVTPTRMSGYDQPADPYSFCGTHCSTCYAVNSYVELKPGQEVTIARLGPNAERMLIAEGTIDCTHMTPVEGNRNAVYIKVKDRDAFFDKQSLVGNHLSFVYGHVARELGQLCQSLGIGPVIA